MKRNTQLKVKLKTLGAESKFIRLEELKLKKQGQGASPQRNSLYRHRIDVVRREARLTLLTYQFMRGVPYEVCEKPKPENALKVTHVADIAAMVTRFDRSGLNKVVEDQVKKWLEGAASPFAKDDQQLPSVRTAGGFAS